MRLLVKFHLERAGYLPMNHQHALSGLVYRLLGCSDSDYARFLHDEGYRLAEERSKRFKMFVFSTLRVDRARRREVGDRLLVQPGMVEWLISSPMDDFLLHGATGLLSVGSVVEVCDLSLTIQELSALPEPEYVSGMRCTCLTPIVVSKPLEDKRIYYLRPSDGAAFSEAVRSNLLHKYRLLHDAPPDEDTFALTFDSAYLADPKHRGGTKKVTVKNGIDVVGAFCPFTLTGSPALIELGYQAGFGEKNATGFGMAATSLTPTKVEGV